MYLTAVFILLKPEEIDALEAFLDVRLNPEGILGLGEDLQELIVREEKEPENGLKIVFTHATQKVCSTHFLFSLHKDSILSERVSQKFFSPFEPSFYILHAKNMPQDLLLIRKYV